MSDYRPCQHAVRRRGEKHKTLYANVELWLDSPPDAILFGKYRYVLDKRGGDEEKCDQSS